MNRNIRLGLWQHDYRLGDDCKIKHGFAFKGESMTTQDHDTLPIVVNIVNFQYTGGFRFESTKIQRYVGAYPKEYELHPGDLLVVMTCQTPKGEILGVPGRIPRDGRRYLHNQRMGLAVIQEKKALDLGFLYYLFLSPQFNTHLFKTATGAKILHTAPSRIEDYRFARPPLQTQRRIASILCAYDDLIENNTRRIKILEQIAQMLYREWFVNFRFPGHEKVRMVESELGRIPEGWSTATLKGFFEHTIGGGWGAEQQSDDYSIPAYVIRGTDIPVARLGSVNDCPLRFHKESNLTSRRLSAGDLVFEVSGGSKGQPVGRALLVGSTLLGQFTTDVICASFCKLLRPQRETTLSTFLYCFLSEAYGNGLIERYQVQSTGISNFKFTDFMNEVRVPLSSPLASRFVETVSPMFDAVAVIGKQNANLSATRDLLLPKLISGEISVEASESLAAVAVETA